MRKRTCFDYAIEILTKRVMLEVDLEKKLRKKGFKEDEIKETIQKLSEMGYLKKEDYVESYILKGMRKLWDKEKIQRDLEKIAPKDMVMEKLHELYNENQILTRLQKVYKNYLSQSKDEKKAKQRFFQYLLRRGFNTHKASALLNYLDKVLSNTPS